jgi:hypothetical protein
VGREAFRSAAEGSAFGFASHEMSLYLAIQFRQFPSDQFQKDGLNPPGTEPTEGRARRTKGSGARAYAQGELPLCRHYHQNSLQFPAVPGLDFSWASWDR